MDLLYSSCRLLREIWRIVQFWKSFRVYLMFNFLPFVIWNLFRKVFWTRFVRNAAVFFIQALVFPLWIRIILSYLKIIVIRCHKTEYSITFCCVSDRILLSDVVDQTIRTSHSTAKPRVAKISVATVKSPAPQLSQFPYHSKPPIYWLRLIAPCLVFRI